MVQRSLCDVVLIVQDGVVRFASGALEGSGYTADEIVGRRMDELELPAEVLATYRARLAGEAAPAVYPTAIRGKDGRSIPVEISGTRVVLDGTPAVLAVMRDITNRLQSEAALAESEERFRSLSAASFEGIAIHRGGVVVEVNDAFCEITGYEREDAIGKPILAFAAPQSHERIMAKVAAGYDRPYEVVGLHRDGTTRPIMLSGKNMTYMGEPARVTAIVDITEIKRAEADRLELQAKMQQAQRLESLGVLAGGIAHDFNNLLMGILGNAALVLEQLPPGTDLRPLVDDVVLAAEHLAGLTEQLLAYSGKGRFVIEPVVLSELVGQMADLLRMSTSKRTVLRFELGQDLPALAADVNQIRQVVMNLVTNASESTGERGGVVVVRTTTVGGDDLDLSSFLVGPSPPRGRCVLLEVTDTGSGMDAQTAARVFDPFFTTKFAGRGLGLAAVVGIVQGHGGAIRVASAPGKGSTFTVLLPVGHAPDTEQTDAGAHPTLGQTPLVLVIDDEETVLRVVKRMLATLGYRVVTADDGRSGLALLGTHGGEVAAVLLDATMPHMDGFEVLAEIERTWPGTKVVLCSGYSEEEATRRFASDRLAGFLHKPFRVERLDELLHRVTTR